MGGNEECQDSYQPDQEAIFHERLIQRRSQSRAGWKLNWTPNICERRYF
jgi:hypothetical protein